MVHMHQHSSSETIHQHSSSEASQTYVFKLYNINCCEDCPKKLEKALQERLHGIESAEVDARKSLATVKGSIDSKAVIDQIKKWGKKAELVPEREDTNPYGYTVESNDRDGEKEDLFNASSRHEDPSSHHEDSSCHQKDSSVRQKDSSHQKDSSARHKNNLSRIRGKNRSSGNAPKKNDNSESNASSPKGIPDHICRDKYCTLHKRDNYKTSDNMPNVNNGTGHPSLYHGSGNNNPMMNPFVQRPPMYAPPPLHYQGQYYGPRMFHRW